MVRDEKPRLDGVGGIPNGTAKRCPEVGEMSGESFDLGDRLESIKSDTLRFLQEILKADAAGDLRPVTEYWDDPNKRRAPLRRNTTSASPVHWRSTYRRGAETLGRRNQERASRDCSG